MTKLPTKEAKKNTQVRPKYHDRPPRREVQFTINLDSIRDKVSRTPMMTEWLGLLKSFRMLLTLLKM